MSVPCLKVMKIRPLHDRIVVEPHSAEQKTAGGIILPDTAQEKPQEGKVVAVGTGYRDGHGHVTKLDVKKGDRVLYGKWSGTEIKVDGKDMLILRESDVLGVLEGKSPSSIVVKGAAQPAMASAGAGHVHIPGDECC